MMYNFDGIFGRIWNQMILIICQQLDINDSIGFGKDVQRTDQNKSCSLEEELL